MQTNERTRRCTSYDLPFESYNLASIRGLMRRRILHGHPRDVERPRNLQDVPRLNRADLAPSIARRLNRQIGIAAKTDSAFDKRRLASRFQPQPSKTQSPRSRNVNVPSPAAQRDSPVRGSPSATLAFTSQPRNSIFRIRTSPRPARRASNSSRPTPCVVKCNVPLAVPAKRSADARRSRQLRKIHLIEVRRNLIRRPRQKFRRHPRVAPCRPPTVHPLRADQDANRRANLRRAPAETLNFSIVNSSTRSSPSALIRRTSSLACSFWLLRGAPPSSDGNKRCNHPGRARGPIHRSNSVASR